MGLHAGDKIGQESLRIAAQGVMVNLSRPPAQFRLPLHQVRPVALVDQVKRSGHAGHTAADDQCVVVEGLRLGVEREEQPGSGHGHSHQVFGLAGCLVWLLAVHPTALIADVGHLKEVGIQSCATNCLAEDRFVGARRAGSDDDPVQAVLLYALLDQLQRVGGAGINRILGVDDVRQV